MAEYPTSIGIMFPASWPDNLDDAHCTLIYLGEMAKAEFSREDIELVIKRLDTRAPEEVIITGLELFGRDKNVLVATLDFIKLAPIRGAFDRTLAKIGVYNASEFTDYKPHVTISEDFSGTLEDAYKDIKLPKTLFLGAPKLWWGNER